MGGWVGGWVVVQVFTFIKHGGRKVIYGKMLVKYIQLLWKQYCSLNK